VSLTVVGCWVCYSDILQDIIIISFFSTPSFSSFFLLFLLLPVGPAEFRRTHCSLPRLIVLNPLFGSRIHLQSRSTSDGVRDLYQLKEELWARNGRSNLAWQMLLPCHWGIFNMLQSCDMGQTGFTSPPKEGMLRVFSPEKSDVFGRIWTRELGYQRPAC
jgi:hypothetical protein